MHTSIRTPMVELSAGMLKADTGAPKRGAPSIHQGGNYEHYLRRDLFKFGGVAAAGAMGVSMLGAAHPSSR